MLTQISVQNLYFNKLSINSSLGVSFPLIIVFFISVKLLVIIQNSYSY